ncbi:MAG TPA: rhomboid family intramembrane serine protease [Bacteroidales bacterium]|nr:rhomboid family intramembrane serine protease [Bacteroidales bacterium]
MNDNRLFGPSSFSLFPPAVKNLLIINVIFYLATVVFVNRGIDLVNMLGLHYPASPYFRWYQFITYMFMHGSFMHLFSNMFALWMFGYMLENVWGTKKFLIFYFITGLGASLFQLGVNYIEFSNIQKAITLYSQTLNQQDFIAILDKYFANIYDPNKVNELLSNWDSVAPLTVNSLNSLLAMMMNVPMVGASGAIFGILLAFGLMFPNVPVFIYGLLPVRAIVFVIIYGAFEFFAGVYQPHSGIAHFAHLGGMLFGFILMLIWGYRFKPYNFYH